MQSEMNDLCRESRKGGLMINYTKTEEESKQYSRQANNNRE